MDADKHLYFIENIALNLFLETAGDGKYFADGARDYFNGICQFMIHQKENIKFPEIVTAILNGNGIDWVKNVVAGDCPEAREYLASYWGQNEKNIAGCYGVRYQTVRPFNSKILNRFWM